jgi:hypothetical protein
MSKQNKSIHTKASPRVQNSVSGGMTRDEWLLKVVAICRDKYSIDEDDIRRFIKLYQKDRRK